MMQSPQIPPCIWISGPINSGKSTVASHLTEKLGRAVNLELDALAAFAQCLPIDQKLEFVIQDGLDVACNWAGRGFVPILNWPVYGQELTFMISYAAKVGLNPILFNLTPSLDIAKSNRGERILEAWERDRIDYLYAVGQMGTPTWGHHLDNSHLSVAETVSLIFEQLKKQNLVV
jgi:hypothetical protein